MDQITLNSDLCCDALVIPGTALEKCLREANESQLKIYLYLLKNGKQNPTVSSIADYFNYSEQDVKRALRFWNCRGQAGTRPAGGNVVEFSAKPVYSKEKLAQFLDKDDVSELMLIAEQYMGRTINPEEISTVLYIYEELGFSAELIEYLLEYCISSNQKSFRSIESVAKEWKESGADTLEEAKKLTMHVPKEMKEVMAALGLSADREPTEAQMAYVRRWTKIFGYGMDIIREACSRTVLSTGKPNMRYVNSILKKWHDAGVKKPADIIAADEEFFSKKAAETKPVAKKTETKKKQAEKFHNFNEREYDYDSLMKDVVD
ncbi:MAG: DnaD domain protein [Lachnospiraceae bacterium]|nr:DnaD domain protein [Lachnospiraceae bacterium]